jgi:hypothetical protein
MLELAAAAVALMLPYIKRTFTPVGQEVADDVSDAAGAKLKALYEKIRQKFRKGSYQGALLDGVEESPNDTDRQETLTRELAKQLEADQAFRESVTSLVDSIKGTSYSYIAHGENVGIMGQNVEIKGRTVVGRDQINIRGNKDGS